MIRTEHQEQKAIMAWANSMLVQYPELHWLHAIPNGGKRGKIAGSMLKKEGVKAGVPDLFLDWPVGSYHGLRIELKKEHREGERNTYPSEEQLLWQQHYILRGYCYRICWGASEAIESITAYLGQ
jgi:hypothetical protein